jgi:hypothetical protein
MQMSENQTDENDFEIEMEPEEVVSEEAAAPEKKPDPSADVSDDAELENYSEKVQNRIKKLTEKYRKEERDRAEAVRLSQQLLEENKKLKSRVQQLDSGYLTEYGNRLESQLLATKEAYKQAYNSGNADAMADAQLKLSNLAAEQQKYDAAKVRFQQQQRVQTQPQQAPAPAPVASTPVQQPVRPDPKAESWAKKNAWFGEDRVMTTSAFAIHQGLIEEEGFDPQSDEYYTELDKRMRREFPHKFQSQKSGGGTQVASAGSSASRSTKPGRRTVKLTPSQVAIAKKLNVPLEEYAKYVKD